MTPRCSRWSGSALAGSLLLAVALPAHAGDDTTTSDKPADKKVDDARKKEAAERFERGLKLFNSGDNAGALAEFKRIHEIMPNAIVLYNLGLVYAAMGRSVDAVDALEAAIAAGGPAPSDVARAEQTLAEQKARVGRLTVVTKPEGALIEVDQVQVAKTPLSAPIRVSQGTHIITAIAPGFAPARKEVVIAGNADETLTLELVPTDNKQLANLFVKTRTLGAEVLVDGKVVGKTPLSTTVGLVPGRHTVEARRAGYLSLRREIDLAEGATGDFSFDLEIDPASLGTEGATLVLDPSETPVDVTVDGRRIGTYREPLRLPRGPHKVTVTTAGFIPVDLEVNLESTVSNLVRVEFDPTAETRERYESSANFHRLWGFVGVVAGAAIGGTGTALAVIGSSKQEKADAEVAEMNRKLVNSEPPCDHRSDFESQGGSSAPCDTARADAQKDLDSAKTMKIGGFVGIGVGAGVLVGGLVLLLTGDDPDRYERSRSTAQDDAPRRRVSFVAGPGEAGAGLRFSF
jgi:hypothetical protein